jgi:hypothetical protein
LPSSVENKIRQKIKSGKAQGGNAENLSELRRLLGWGGTARRADNDDLMAASASTIPVAASVSEWV